MEEALVQAFSKLDRRIDVFHRAPASVDRCFGRSRPPPDLRFLPPASSARRAFCASLVRSVPHALPPIA